MDLKSGAVPSGAVVGGALGLASAGGKSSSKKARNALVGAAAGGAIAGAAQGSQKGMLYQVEVGSGEIVQVVSDQREIRSGDCVAVEKSGDTANIRRVSASYCDKANQAAVAGGRQRGPQGRRGVRERAKQQLVDCEDGARSGSGRHARSGFSATTECSALPYILRVDGYARSGKLDRFAEAPMRVTP